MTSTTLTEAYLLDKFGPLVPFAEVAKLLRRSHTSLRIALNGDAVWARPLRTAQRKIGRRVFVHVSGVAKVMDGGDQSE